MENSYLCSGCNQNAIYICLCDSKVKHCEDHESKCQCNSHHEDSLLYVPRDDFSVEIDPWIYTYQEAYNHSTKKFSKYLQEIFKFKRQVEEKVYQQQEKYRERYTKNDPNGPCEVLVKGDEQLLIKVMDSRNVRDFFNQNILYKLTTNPDILMGKDQIRNEEQYLKARLILFREAFLRFLKEFSFKSSCFVSSLERKLMKLLGLKDTYFLHLFKRKLLFKTLLYNCEWVTRKLTIDNLHDFLESSKVIKTLKHQENLEFICNQFHRIYSTTTSSKEELTTRKGHIKVLKFLLKSQNLLDSSSFFILKKKEIKIIDIRNSKDFIYIFICKKNLGNI